VGPFAFWGAYDEETSSSHSHPQIRAKRATGFPYSAVSILTQKMNPKFIPDYASLTMNIVRNGAENEERRNFTGTFSQSTSFTHIYPHTTKD
jgi:hypothetical protein